MTKKRILFVVLVALFLFLVSGKLCPAQGLQNPCLERTIWYFPDPLLLGWWVYGPGQGPFSYIIAAYTYKCPPPPECPCPGCCGGSSGSSPGGNGGSPPSSTPQIPGGGKPIVLTTGDTYIEDTDVSLPGLGGGLILHRRWNSLWPPNEIASSIGIFGPNWRSTYEEKVFMGSDNYLKYARGDGGYWSFGLNDVGTFVVLSPGSVSASLTQTSSCVLLKFLNGEQRQFSLATGLLTAIVDRNGNTTQLTYDGFNRLSTVADPAGRHLYFNYPNDSSLLVNSVTSDFGVTLSYFYDAQGRLTQVTKPDQTTISYTYNAQSQIVQVTDSNGKVLESHTYDSSGRGLTSSEANGVNSLSVTYPQ